MKSLTHKMRQQVTGITCHQCKEINASSETSANITQEGIVKDLPATAHIFGLDFKKFTSIPRGKSAV